MNCLDERTDDPCYGAVEYRTALSGTGISYPRCDRHWERRLDKQQELDEKYPDSDVPPSWFDPTAAGERWEEDY